MSGSAPHQAPVDDAPGEAPAPPRPATGDRHVVVVGMHRSGTSATAGALAALGLSTPDPADLLPATPHNERGHWESRTLVTFHNRCLRQLGGWWSAPPSLPSRWHGDVAMDGDAQVASILAEARRLAATVLARPPMVLKDPRLCLFLPLWRAVLPAPPVAVLVLRHPADVARSLRARDGLPLSLGLALWDRYTRQAVGAVAGLPVFAVDYDALLEQPGPTLAALVTFLGSHGVDADPTRTAAAAAALTPGLRHQSDDGRRDGPLDPALRQLLLDLAATLGPHHRWSPPPLPDPPGWVDDVIALQGQLRQARLELAGMRSSRLLRLGERVRRLAGR